jgi:23S rRNA (guanine745-N1)-methyltransferase
LPLTFQIQLSSGQQIQDLLMMTPHGHRISVETKEKLEKIPSLDLTVDVVFRLLRKI